MARLSTPEPGRSAPRPVVVFDLGGVLIDWNPRYLYRRLFGDEARVGWFLDHVCTPDWNAAMDAGRPFAEAIAELAFRFPALAAEIRAYRDRWPDMLGGPIGGSVAILEQLARTGVRLAGLSNWSAETFELVRGHRSYRFLGHLDPLVISGEVGAAKPSPAIFHHLLERLRCEPRACLFIDDSLPNIAAAQRLGMDTHLFRSPAGLAAALRARGLSV